ncbi:hypothetical protein [Virgibacillus sp. Bac330]|uniref:ATP-binding protein n=1 Tax=Virgibacillus sp. Bac330 TaxID=2419841 RepID=UPI000EF46C91|nr:hypothetical protein [Virgibacillus sp. Bac330]
MEEISSEWLPHLSNEIVTDAQGYLLDAYAVALEGWRRGLTLRWHVKDSEKFKEMSTWYVDNPGQLFSLRSESHTHYFFRTRGDKVTNDAVRIGKDKDLTKQALSRADVPVPKGRQFTNEEPDEAIVAYANEIGYPVVIKPIDGSFGRGVISNITTSGELIHSVSYLRSELGYQDIILEKHISGNDYRLYVVGDKVVGAMHRVPPNVVGDGVNSIQALIQLKNEQRSLNPRLESCPIPVNDEIIDFIGRKGYTLDSVPEKGAHIYLSDKCNISIGGDPIDVLDTLDETTKNIAVNALNAVDGLTHGAVDVIVDEKAEAEERAVVIELNPTAQIGGLLFPIKGKARDIPAAIIDFYFPETAGKQLPNKERIYFDLHDVLDPLSNGTAVVSTVINLKPYFLYSKKLTVSGEILNPNFFNYIHDFFLVNHVFGFLKKSDSSKIEFVLSSYNKNIFNELKSILYSTNLINVKQIEEKEWPLPIKAGFKFIKNDRQLVEQLLVLKKELLEVKKENMLVKRRYESLVNSMAWKINKPSRFIKSLFSRSS